MTSASQMPRERPVIFSGESVRAILDGRKTQTRRVVRPQPEGELDAPHGFAFAARGLTLPCLTQLDAWGNEIGIRASCRLGGVGQRLWVRETFCHVEDRILYRAEEADALERPHSGVVWVNPIFMPRWASRLTLLIADVRVERLQEITAEGCLKEGISVDDARPGFDVDIDGAFFGGFLRERFRAGWDAINGKRGYSWDTNPWVFVISFKRA